MTNRNGVSRGDRNRNARLARLRELVPLTNAEDLTFDKTDDKDAVLIARLRCYVPEPVDETWGRLRHLGARRERLIVEASAEVQKIRDLLECVWPAALETANWPFRSKTWPAALWVILDRDGGDFTRSRRLGLARFETAVRREITKRGGKRACGSSAGCSPRWRIRPGWSRTAAAPWSGSSCCWRTGPTPNAS